MSNGKNHRFRPPLYHGDPNDVAATGIDRLTKAFPGALVLEAAEVTT